MDGPKTPTPILLLRGRLNRSPFMEWRVIRIPPTNTSRMIAFIALIGEHSTRAEPFPTWSRSRPLIREPTRRTRRTLLRLKAWASYYLLSLVALQLFDSPDTRSDYADRQDHSGNAYKLFILCGQQKCCETTAYDEHLTTAAEHFLTASVYTNGFLIEHFP